MAPASLVLCTLASQGQAEHHHVRLGLSMWNSVPDNLRNLAVVRDSFRGLLNMFLFAAY